MNNKEKIICLQLLHSRVFIVALISTYFFKTHSVEIFKETFGVAHAVQLPMI